MKHKTPCCNNFITRKFNHILILNLISNDSHSTQAFSRICQNSDILCILTKRRKFAVEPGRALYSLINCSQIAHGLFRLYPRATALTPAGAIEKSHLDIEFRSSLEHCMHDLPPFLCEHTYRTVWCTLSVTDHTDLNAVDTHSLHRMKILYNTFLRDVSVKPIPIHSQRLLLRSLGKLLLHHIKSVSLCQLA